MLRTFLFGLLLCSASTTFTSAQSSSPAAPASPDTDYCSTLSDGVEHGNALRNFCGWVLSFDAKLPNIIGDQQTHRYHTDNGKKRKLIDTTSARIAYVDGRPRFSEVSINHVTVPQNGDLPETLELHGAWSYTDYGSDLRLLMRDDAKAHFRYAGEGSWHGTPVIAFAYEVSSVNNLRWEMKAREKLGAPLQSAFPGYRGRIMLDRETFALVRFERHTTDVEKHFPLRSGSNEVDYKRLPLGDGTSFVLPVESVVTFCHDNKHHNCEVNDTTFENWQKFVAKTRILTDTNPQ